MRRRQTLGWATTIATAMATATPLLLLPGCEMSEVKTFPSLAAAQKAIAGLATGWRSSDNFNLPQMLNHAAQSVEYSLRGFPQMKPALFRHTVGSAAFAMFDARGVMRHALAEPIPRRAAVGRCRCPASGHRALAKKRCKTSMRTVARWHRISLMAHWTSRSFCVPI